MPEHFSASQSVQSAPLAEDALERTIERDAEAELFAALDRVEARVQAVRAEDADRPVDPLVLAALARAAEDAGAPFESRWLAGRVAEGDLTWADVWRAPEAHAGGLWLWSRAAQELAGGAER